MLKKDLIFSAILYSIFYFLILFFAYLTDSDNFFSFLDRDNNGNEPACKCIKNISLKAKGGYLYVNVILKSKMQYFHEQYPNLIRIIKKGDVNSVEYRNSDAIETVFDSDNSFYQKYFINEHGIIEFKAICLEKLLTTSHIHNDIRDSQLNFSYYANKDHIFNFCVTEDSIQFNNTGYSLVPTNHHFSASFESHMDGVLNPGISALFISKTLTKMSSAQEHIAVAAYLNEVISKHNSTLYIFPEQKEFIVSKIISQAYPINVEIIKDSVICLSEGETLSPSMEISDVILNTLKQSISSIKVLMNMKRSILIDYRDLSSLIAYLPNSSIIDYSKNGFSRTIQDIEDSSSLIAFEDDPNIGLSFFMNDNATLFVLTNNTYSAEWRSSIKRLHKKSVLIQFSYKNGEPYLDEGAINVITKMSIR